MRDIYELFNEADVDISLYKDEGLSDIDRKRVKKRMKRKLHLHNPPLQRGRYRLAAISLFAVICLGFATGLPVKALSGIPFFRMLMADHLKSDAAVIQRYTTTVGQTVSDSGMDIRLDDVLVDEGQLLIAYTVHATDTNLEGIGFPWMSVYVNGTEIPRNGNGNKSRLNAATISFVQAVDLPDHMLKGSMDIQIVISGLPFQNRDTINGTWGFAMTTSPEKLMRETKEITVHHQIALDNGQIITVSKLVLSPVSTTLYYEISGGNEWDMHFIMTDQTGKSIEQQSARSNMKSNFNRYPALKGQETELLLTPVIMPGAESEDHVLKRETLTELSFTIQIPGP